MDSVGLVGSDFPDQGIGPRSQFPVTAPRNSGDGCGSTLPKGQKSSNGNVLPDKTAEKFTPFDAVLTILAMIGYLFDLGSDIFVAFMHYHYKNYWWFGLTVSFIVLPSLTVAAFSLVWYIQDGKTVRGTDESRKRWAVRYIFVFLQLSPLMRYIDMLVYGFRLQEEKRLREETDSALLRLFKSFLEAAPQLTLQLYILILNGVEGHIIYEIGQVVSCTTSLCSLSWSLVVYQKTLRSLLPKKRSLSYCAMVPMFLSQMFIIGARVVCFAMFASSFSYWIFTIAGCHWCVMFVWIFLQKSELCTNSIGEFFFKIVLTTVHIFCFLSICKGHTRLRYAIFYTLVYLENMAMMVTWYSFRPTENPWYVLPAMVFVLGLFFVGILFQVVYYVHFHPNNCKDSGTRIHVWVPFNELKGTVCTIGD